MKIQKRQSVLQSWIEELSFTQQAVLVLALRGPDGISKYSSAKLVIYYLRGLVLNAAYEYSGNNESEFMREDYKNFNSICSSFFHDVDAYPMHFLMHLCHASEIIGYKHPFPYVREYWFRFYSYFCKSLHMTPETEEELDKRLSK